MERGPVRTGLLIRDKVAVAEAGRIDTVLRDEAHRLSGTVFVWSRSARGRVGHV